MAEVGELLVVARCSVSMQAYFLSAINATARLVEILSIALDGSLRFITTPWNPTGPPKSSDGHVCSLQA